ncbi:hypothetical protein ABIA33_005537 [Streptacidiphilus sp. MAP12-16]|uniref:hypothetical protein n=1 Tax=Streptacidiphilus sp. MAP12-16 TaxID=3156300 RepID=UPI003514A38F
MVRTRHLAAALLLPLPLLALPTALPTARAATPAAAPATTRLPTTAAPPAGSTVAGLVVSVGYAEDKEINTPDPASFPVPWAGAPDTVFLGGTVPGQTACGTLPACYDAGALRLDNPTSAPVTVSRVDVDMHSSLTGGKVFPNLWGSFTVPPGRSVILTENPPGNNPSYDNFDTSGFPGNNCTPLTVAPTVTLTVGGVASTLVDSTHVLDTNGIDLGFCKPAHNESLQWRPIGTPSATPGSSRASVTLDDATPAVTAGQARTTSAILLDSGGFGLPDVTVSFKVIGGPDAGLTETAVTAADGRAAFSYTPSGTGQDDLLASVTTVGSFSSPPPLPCPAPWTCADIGSPALTGQQSYDPSADTWTISAGGTDITGTADQFRSVSQPLTGDGSVVAHLDTQSASSSNAKAGPMLRASNDPGAAYYAVLVSPGAGIKVQKRATTGGGTTKLANPAGTAPAWLKITRSGAVFTAYTSADGTTWTLIPGSTTTLALTGPLLGGLAVTSHNAAALGTVTANGLRVG